MFIEIQPNDPRPIYQQIMDEIRRGMILDLLVPNDPLPSVRQLASDLKVNPNTVQQAYRELEREGYVYVLRGRGTFVAEHSVDDRSRRELVDEVASRISKEAYRNGLSLADLIGALERLLEDATTPPEEDAT